MKLGTDFVKGVVVRVSIKFVNVDDVLRVSPSSPRFPNKTARFGDESRRRVRYEGRLGKGRHPDGCENLLISACVTGRDSQGGRSYLLLDRPVQAMVRLSEHCPTFWWFGVLVLHSSTVIAWTLFGP